MKRTFIAIDIPFNDQMSQCLNDFKSSLLSEKIRWLNEDQSHLTLKFLGETGENKISEINEKLKNSCSSFSPFKLIIQNTGIFPNLQNPKIVWFGIEPNDQLSSLHSVIEKEMKFFGFEPEKRTFTPHLTIGRIKFLKNRNLLKQILEEYSNSLLHTITVEQVIFYESILKPDGAIYEKLGKHSLKPE
ncbi:MAG: RNA 2',3'-cyclic phosphodiesterase [Bacteroidales bacterium]|nr:RNA 2',3'-cyclic phosphodiesterase [Bacteroidales bacterium]